MMNSQPQGGWTLAVALLLSPMVAYGQHDHHGAANGHGATTNTALQIKLHLSKQSIERAVQLPIKSDDVLLDHTEYFPEAGGRISFKEFLVSAVPEQVVLPTAPAKGSPCLELAIDGPKHAYRRWLVSGDVARNRLTSMIGQWRFVAVDNEQQRDDLFAAFKVENSKKPVIHISNNQGVELAEFDANAGVTHALPENGYAFRVKRFVDHFAFDEKTKQVRSLSDDLANPAVLVEIEHDGQRFEKWLFSRFPTFRKDGDPQFPFTIQLECPTIDEGAPPNYVIVSMNSDRYEVWSHIDKMAEVKVVSLGEKLSIPESSYTFHLATYIASGVLSEQFKPGNRTDGVAALRFEIISDASEKLNLWMEANRKYVFETPIGELRAEFAFGGGAGGQSLNHHRR